MTDERAVSDVISFVLVFSLITASVGAVTVFGLGGLQDARDAEHLNNAERALDVFADNMEDMSHHDAPSRATEIKLAGSSVTIAETVDMNTSVSDTPGGDPADFRPIIFSTDSGTELAYEGGAIIRTERTGGVMVREPAFSFSENRTIIKYVEPVSAETQRIGGSTTILLRGELAVTKVFQVRAVDSTDSITFTISTTPQRAVVWNRYLESEIAWTNANTPADPCSVSGGDVTCTFQSDELVVATSRIEVSFS